MSNQLPVPYLTRVERILWNSREVNEKKRVEERTTQFREKYRSTQENFKQQNENFKITSEEIDTTSSVPCRKSSRNKTVSRRLQYYELSNKKPPVTHFTKCIVGNRNNCTK